jgi:putative transposase
MLSFMPRTTRADEGGGVYHALNRGNARQRIFRKDADYEAFERILADGLARSDVRLYSYILMPNHWHMILRPNRDGQMGEFLRWVTVTHTMRYHAHHHTGGHGHLYQGRFKSFPIQDDGHFVTVCRYAERNALRAGMVKRAEDWRFGSLWRWAQATEPSPTLLSPWPVPRSPNWLDRVNEPMSEPELAAVRLSIQRGRPYGDEKWTAATAARLGLVSTLRPRGRPQVRKREPNKGT